MTVRSTLLGIAFDNTAGSRSSVIYTVPAGRRTIVKECILSGVSGTSTGSALWILDGANGYRIALTTAALPHVERRELWTVLNAGMQLQWTRNVGASTLIEIAVSGAELLA